MLLSIEKDFQPAFDNEEHQFLDVQAQHKSSYFWKHSNLCKWKVEQHHQGLKCIKLSWNIFGVEAKMDNEQIDFIFQNFYYESVSPSLLFCRGFISQ